MGNHNGKEATYAISSAGAQSIPVRRDVLDEDLTASGVKIETKLESGCWK